MFQSQKEVKQRNICILGSTGSIGTQALDVIRANPQLLKAEVLTASKNADLLIKQAIEFKPNAVVIADDNLYQIVADVLQPLDIKVFSGEKALCYVTEMESVDMVLAAMVGYAGLLPVVSGIKSRKPIALANKETLVVAGDIITQMAAEYNVHLLPVDSEHSAIFQCLVGEQNNPIEKLILTASGGPFRGKTRADLEKVTREQALKHPNWEMGAKITIDSATLMNKGLEVIEAKWLFNCDHTKIDVVVHPQSIVHSMVQFRDGSIKAQMGLPDMKLPIQYALGFPARLDSNFPRLDFTQYPSLTFEKPDMETFKNLSLAYHAIEKGGNLACILNAANEVAVELFLKEKITFLQIAEINEKTMEKAHFIAKPSLDDYIQSDTEARNIAKEL